MSYEASFIKLNDLLLAPILTLPIAGEGFPIYCDASSVGLVSVLM